MPLLCDWPVDVSCLPPLPAENDPTFEAKAAEHNQNVAIAIAVLFALSGRQFMCQEVTVRPQPYSGAGLCDDAPLIEAYYRNDYRGVTGLGGSPKVIKLNGPVMEISSVIVDGVTMDPSEYTLENDSLFKLDGRWPRNDMSVPSGFPGTWTVTYVQGRPPPAFVAKYVGRLASEMIVACEDAKRCKLPRTVVSTSRSGVTHVFDPTRMLAAGFTGVPEIDTWLASVNRSKLASSARVL